MHLQELEEHEEDNWSVRVCGSCKEEGSLLTLRELCDVANDYKSLKADYADLYETLSPDFAD